MKLKKIDLFLLIFLAILVVLTIMFIINPELGNIFALDQYTDPDGDIATLAFWTGLGFIAIVCFLGALVPFPVPYTLIVALLALNFWNTTPIPFLGVLIMIIIATLANIFGDFFDWVIGYGASKANAKDIEKQPSSEKTEDIAVKAPPVNRWTHIIMTKPHLIPVVIFVFGLTPLPDSLLLMPLGLVKYPLKKTMLWSAIGKFFMMTAVSILGIVALDTAIKLLGGGSWVSGMFFLYLSWLLILVMTKI